MSKPNNARIAVLRQHFTDCDIKEPALQHAACAAPAFARPADFPTLFARPASEECHEATPTRTALPVFRGPSYQPTKAGTYSGYYERASAQPLFARPCKDVAVASKSSPVTQKLMQPQAKLREDASGYQLELELPGVNASSLRIEVQGSQAIVTGQQCTPDGRLLSIKGMPRGVFKTAHRLPAGADHNSLRAVYTQGVLRISMRKQV